MKNPPFVLEYTNDYRVYHGDTGVLIDLYPKDSSKLADTNVSQKEKGINPMREKFEIDNSINIDAPRDTAEDMRRYLAGRALDIFYEKTQKLQNEYKITFDYRPATVQEAAQRLNDGLYTMKGAEKQDPVKYPWSGLQEVFSWRGPDDQPDEKGFGEAIAKLNDNFNTLIDKLRIVDPKDGLELFEAFKATA